MLKKVTHSEQETMEFAKVLASKLNTGDTIVLSGDLGSGKTKFTEGFLKFYGVENEVSSPTFTIVNEYQCKNINIFHFDVYRLENPDDFLNIGGDEYFSNGICIIEWGEKISDFLPKNYLHILFERDFNHDNNTRVLNIVAHGLKYENILKEVFI